MRAITNKFLFGYVSLGLLGMVGGLAAQDQPPVSAPQQDNQAPHAWRRVGDAPDPAAQPDPSPQPDPSAQVASPQFNQGGPPPPPNFSANQAAGQNAPPQAGSPQGNAPQGGPPQAMPQSPPQGMPPAGSPASDNYGIPPRLTIRPGTFVAVRINQWLSSDHNQVGDTFFATLAEPIIVNGIVVAQRGQMVSGRVTEAQKAGRVEGTSKLGVQLTSLTLVDGQQLSIQSQMINRTGPTSVGRDAAAIGGTTALGAAIGAGVDWGRGAAIGAGAGAAAGIIGVLLTRGRPTVIYPESMLTFQLTAPVTVETDHAPQAFRYVEPPDYNTGGYSQRPGARIASAPYGAGPYIAPPPPLPYYYGPAYYPYYWGSGFSLYFGRPYFYGRYGGYRGFRR